jgi:site-specific DNA-cytosine methylase
VSHPDRHEAVVEPAVNLGQDAVTACDLFAGAGGFSLGAHFAQIQVAAAVEFNKHAAATYRAT